MPGIVGNGNIHSLQKNSRLKLAYDSGIDSPSLRRLEPDNYQRISDRMRQHPRGDAGNHTGEGGHFVHLDTGIP